MIYSRQCVVICLASYETSHPLKNVKCVLARLYYRGITNIDILFSVYYLVSQLGYPSFSEGRGHARSRLIYIYREDSGSLYECKPSGMYPVKLSLSSLQLSSLHLDLHSLSACLLLESLLRVLY